MWNNVNKFFSINFLIPCKRIFLTWYWCFICWDYISYISLPRVTFYGNLNYMQSYMHIVKSCFVIFYDACQEQLVLLEWLHSNLDFSFLPPPYGSGVRLTSTSSLFKNQYRANALFLYYLLNLNNFSILLLMLYCYATLKLEREKITIIKKIIC